MIMACPFAFWVPWDSYFSILYAIFLLCSRLWHPCSVGLDEIHFLLSTPLFLCSFYLVNFLLSLSTQVRIYRSGCFFPPVGYMSTWCILITFNIIPQYVIILFFKLVCIHNASNLVEFTTWTTEHFSGIHFVVTMWIKQINSFSLSG